MKSKTVTQHILLICILLLAFYLRLAYLAEIRRVMPDDAIFCGGDALMYDGQARATLKGEWPGDEPFYSVPLYSFYLTYIYHLFGVNFLIPLILQMLLDVVACAAIYWVGKYTFSPLTGLLTALAAALYGPLISYQVCYAQEPLTTSLLFLSFYFILKFYASKRVLYIAVSGAVLGLCALSRPTMLIVAPVILIWFWGERKSFYQFIQKSTLFLFALGLAISPVTFHNYRVTGKIIPISDQGAINLYFGNNPYASEIGPHTVSEQYGQRVRGIFNFPTEFSEIEAKVAAGETTYLRQVFNYISEHPWDWVELTVRKTRLMFLEPDWKILLTSFVYPSSSAALKSSIYLRLFPTEWVALMVGGLLALFFVRHRYTFLIWLTILPINFILIIFFVKFRFRLPLASFLLLLTFAWIAAGREWFHHNRRKFVIVLLILLALFPFVPSLLIFILMYVMIALFPYRKDLLASIRWPLIAGWSYVIVVSFVIQMFVLQKSNSQTQDFYTGPEIWGPIIIGQTFSPDCDGLYQIEVELSRLSFRHDQPYYFHLVRNLDLKGEIFSTRFEVKDVSKWTSKKFTFPPQPHSQQQTYFFYIQSPTSHPNNNITVRLNADLPTVYKRYQQGSIYAGSTDNLQSFPGDLAFAAYCQENLGQLFVRTIEHMTASGPVFLGYAAIYYGVFFLHVLLLLISLFKIGLNKIASFHFATSETNVE
jgi:4-amino-4-deoxy-L-arabinose transferase-like glycosyltransferase